MYIYIYPSLMPFLPFLVSFLPSLISFLPSFLLLSPPFHTVPTGILHSPATKDALSGLCHMQLLHIFTSPYIIKCCTVQQYDPVLCII